MTDIVTIGDATLYHGDCMEILPTLDKVDAVVTDPPYGVGYKGEEWDAEIPNLDWFYLSEKKSRGVMITPGNGNQHKYPRPLWTLSWMRPGSLQMQGQDGGFSHWEPILIYGEFFYKIDARTFPANTGAGDSGHPCSKPVLVMEWIIGGIKKGRINSVIDPFMGSGTTGVACANLGRKFIGIEKERKYFDIACERIQAAYAQGRLAF